MIFVAQQMSENFEFLYNARWLWIWLIGVFIYVRYMYRRETEMASKNWRAVLIVLRVLALMIPLIFLYEPQKTWEERIEKKSTLLVMVDQSLSMSLSSDEYATPALKDRARRTFGDDFASMNRWDQQSFLANQLKDQVIDGNRLRFVSYGSDMMELTDTVSWDKAPLQRHTRLANSLNLALGDMRGESLSGIVLFGDGNIGNLDEISKISERLTGKRQKIPLFSVGVGSPDVVPDVRAVQFHAPEVVVKSKDTINLKGILSSRGLEEGTKVIAKLTLDNEEIAKKEVEIGVEERQEVGFEVVLDRAGEFNYSFDIEAVDGEKVTENNSKKSLIKVKDEKLKVLYIENIPRWDYLKISQFLERNPEIYESSFMLIQASQRIQQRGSKPIRKIPGLQEFEELWNSTDVVILGDVGIKYFAGSNFLENLKKFVSRGGGFIYLSGGYNNPASYQGTILEELCPVFLAPDSLERLRGGEKKAPFQFNPTDVGLNHPVTRMGNNVESSLAYWAGVPLTNWFYRPHGVKPLTQVLIEHPEKVCPLDSKPVPLMASMSYGKGQILYIGIDEMHRWSFLDNDEYMVNRFVSQMVNYMSSRKISGTVGRYILETNATEIPLGDDIEVSVQFDDAGSISDPSLDVKWSRDGVEFSEMRLDRESIDSGTYKGRLKPDRKGQYAFWVDEESQGKKVSVTDFSKEFENAELKKDNLARFSGQDGYHDFDQLDQLIQSILSRQVVQTRRMAQSLLVEPLVWWLLAILMLLLGAEWWIRKRQHLL